MNVCHACGVERDATDASCSQCGAAAARVPELELELDARSRAAPPRPRPVAEREATAIDLAFDPQYVEPTITRSVVRSAAATPAQLTDHEVSDAWFLGDYGEPPKRWFQFPFYAWRVLRRRREIKRALVARAAEAMRTAVEVEDGLVLLAERVRAAAEAVPAYRELLGALRRAEEVLDSRDHVLATEHHEQAARLASIDARLTKLDADLAQARSEEREIATTLVTLQGALVREESNLKRSEAELRAAQQRGPGGTQP